MADLSHRYLWSDQVDELFADEQVTTPSTAGNTLWALSDHLGSIRDIADYNESTGVTSIANHRTMTATGTIVAETNAAIDLLYAFTGKQLDDATGLQHNLFRWYDSVLGQWLSEDPMGFAADDENLRRYVGSQSTAMIDPFGLDEEFLVLLSAYGTYEGIPNVSNDAVREAAEELRELGIATETKLKIPVDWETYKQDMRQLYEEGKRKHPDTHIIYIGMGSGDHLTVENRADNLRDMRWKDIQGKQAGVHVPKFNTPGGQKTFAFDSSHLLRALKSTEPTFRSSNDAGDFLCEAMLYKLGEMLKLGEIDAGTFIHIPRDLTANDAGQVGTKIGSGLGNALLPESDFDGDGVPNKKDSKPFDPGKK